MINQQKDLIGSVVSSNDDSISSSLANNLSLDQVKLNSVLEKLSNLWIKKILIVDDTPANISMAKKYLDNFPLHIDYATNASDAVQKIKDEYKKEKYDLILTDLEMEIEESGFDVAREWFGHQWDTFVVTWINYDRSHDAPHWPTTHVLWLDFSIKSKKNENWTWENVLDAVVNHIWWKGKSLHASLARFHKYVWMPNYELANVYISSIKKT